MIVSGIMAKPPDFQCYACGYVIPEVPEMEAKIRKCPECNSTNVLDLHDQKFGENIPKYKPQENWPFDCEVDPLKKSLF